jgi:hypothetical protein
MWHPSAVPIAPVPMIQRVRLSIEVPPRSRRGDHLPIVLHLANPSPDPVTVSLLGRPTAFDVQVERLNGSVIWRRLAGEFVPQILVLHELAAGGTLSFHESWNQCTNAGDPVEPGAFRVTGSIDSEGESFRTPPVELHIV